MVAGGKGKALLPVIRSWAGFLNEMIKYFFEARVCGRVEGGEMGVGGKGGRSESEGRKE